MTLGQRYRPGFAQAPSFSDPTPNPFPSNLLCCTIPGDGMETICCFSEINKIKSWKLTGAWNNMIDFKGWGGHWTLMSLLFLFPVFQTWNIYSCVQVPVNSAHSRTWLTKDRRTQLLLCLTDKSCCVWDRYITGQRYSCLFLHNTRRGESFRDSKPRCHRRDRYPYLSSMDNKG